MILPAADLPNADEMREEHRRCALINCYALSRNRDLAVASSSPNASPKAKENAGPDHHRNHNCVP